MPPAGFETAFSASDQQQTLALDLLPLRDDNLFSFEITGMR
jgi:hypothetical protein